MRSVETPGGIPVFISKNEYTVYEKICKRIAKDDLSESEQYVAQNLVNKNILKREIVDNTTFYDRNRGSL